MQLLYHIGPLSFIYFNHTVFVNMYPSLLITGDLTLFLSQHVLSFVHYTSIASYYIVRTSMTVYFMSSNVYIAAVYLSLRYIAVICMLVRLYHGTVSVATFIS